MLRPLFGTRLSRRLRLAVAGASVLLLVVLMTPIWGITLYSNQYPDGLRVTVHAGGFEAGEGGADLTEINTLNHYIGMRPLNQADIPELKWIGTAVVVFALLGLAAALVGRAGGLAALVVLFGAFGIGSMWLFYSRLYEYGHDLDPRAAVKVPPFTPPVIGTQELANFTVESYPEVGTWLMLTFAAVLVGVLVAAWRSRRLAAGPQLT